mmetsp:Transcript_30517/g.66959  ORF Transcript_30517/g.66959 Transcript_30517/m.66959 type:complete len:205 (-) Transcript_30517:94-708(-)
MSNPKDTRLRVPRPLIREPHREHGLALHRKRDHVGESLFVARPCIPGPLLILPVSVFLHKITARKISIETRSQHSHRSIGIRVELLRTVRAGNRACTRGGPPHPLHPPCLIATLDPLVVISLHVPTIFRVVLKRGSHRRDHSIHAFNSIAGGHSHSGILVTLVQKRKVKPNTQHRPEIREALVGLHRQHNTSQYPRDQHPGTTL